MIRSRSIFHSTIVIAFIFVCSDSSFAQDDPHAACAAPPSYVPVELLERAVVLRSGVGNSHETVTTTSPQAQAFYDQGLNYLESYVWIEAARSFKQAFRHDPSFDWHHRHNLDLLATCYEHKGQIKMAEKIMREADGLVGMGAYGAYNRREWPSFLIRRARYKEALKAAQAMTRSEHAQARTVGHALTGQALIGLGRVEEARQSLVDARRELEAVPRLAPGIAANRAIVAPWVDALHGELLIRIGNVDEGRKALKDVQRALRATPGPDAWIQTLFRLESIARSAREADEWDLAEHTAAQMIDHDAAYGGSHFAMALVLQHKGDAAGAAREFEAARRYWQNADPDLPELREIMKATASVR